MKVGIDLVFIPEFKKRLNSGDLSKVFTEAELKENTSPESLAGVFAAKEAFMKALGRKIDWLEVWLEKQASGKPTLSSTQLSKDRQVEVSVSHDGDYAVACVVIEP